MAILITGMFGPSGGAGSFNLYDPADMAAGDVNVLLTLIAGGKISSNGVIGEIINQSGSGTPVHSATEGVLYWDTAANLLYCNNNGSTGWTAVGSGAGPTGAMGPRGLDGEDGADGWPGPPGAQGAAGAAGATGAVGAAGAMGPPGQDGGGEDSYDWPRNAADSEKYAIVDLLEGMFLGGPQRAGASSAAANHVGKVVRVPPGAKRIDLSAPNCGFYANVATQATGASLKYDVCKGSDLTSAPTSLFTTTFPEIAVSKNETTEAGGSAGALTGIVSPGDRLFVFVTQIGSTIRGYDHTIHLWARVYY